MVFDKIKDGLKDSKLASEVKPKAQLKPLKVYSRRVKKKLNEEPSVRIRWLE